MMAPKYRYDEHYHANSIINHHPIHPPQVEPLLFDGAGGVDDSSASARPFATLTTSNVVPTTGDAVCLTSRCSVCDATLAAAAAAACVFADCRPHHHRCSATGWRMWA